MIKSLLSSFYPVSCVRYSNQNLLPGDLLFYRADSIFSNFSNFITGIIAVSSEPIYHVAMIVESDQNNITIVQASPGRGVFASSYKSICDVEGVFNIIEVYRVDADQVITSRAVEIAMQYIGDSYNDIFSPVFINSKGERSFYCSQLIQRAYNEASESEIFPSHPMGFPLQDGKVSDDWLKYFENLNAEVPVGVNGSHPGIMYDSEFLFCVT